MKKQLYTTLLICLCAMSACNENGDGKTGDELRSCTASTFMPSCLSPTSYTVCRDNAIIIKSCAGSATCVEGQCQIEATDCTVDTYTPICVDDEHKSNCSSLGKVESQACPTGTICQNGECITDNSCDHLVYIANCTDGKHRKYCTDADRFETEECGEDAICMGGECTTETDCQQDGFVSECQGRAQRTICTEEGKIESDDCPANSVCENGECIGGQLNDSCDVSTFANTCDGDKRIACDDGVVVESDCSGDGLICYEGDCKLAGTVTCDSNVYEDKCIGNTAVSCIGSYAYVDKLYAYDCSRDDEICAVVDGRASCYEACTIEEFENKNLYQCDSNMKSGYSVTCIESQDNRYVLIYNDDGDELVCDDEKMEVCMNGSCVVNEQLAHCSPEIDQSFCQNNILYYCPENDNSYFYEGCYSDEMCITIDGIPDCYEKCDTEGAVEYHCMTPFCMVDEAENCHPISSNSAGKAWKYTCTKTSNGLIWIKSDAECYYCADSSGYYHGYTGDVCINTETEKRENYCNGNVATNIVVVQLTQDVEINFKYFEVPTDCEELQCVIVDEKAVCLESCSAAEKDKTKYVCEIDDPYGAQVNYESTSYICTQIGNQYYWVYDDSIRCDHGCDSNQQCVKIHEDEYNACSSWSDEPDYYASKCEHNIGLRCSDHSVEAMDCGNKICAVIDENIGCFESCTQEEIAAGQIDTCDGSYLYHQVCTKVENDKYIVNEFNEYCDHGCDAKSNRCAIIHELEGKSCDPEKDSSKCDNDIYLSCSSTSFPDDKDSYVWRATQCSEGPTPYPNLTYVCAERQMDDNFTQVGCAIQCPDNDTTKYNLSCSFGTLLYEMCQTTDSGSFLNPTYEYCVHGCNDEGTGCLFIHEDEGKPCNSDTANFCANDTILLSCYDTYIATDCSTYFSSDGKGVCKNTDGYVRCIDPCTQKEYEDRATKSICDAYDKLNTYTCEKFDDYYRWYQSSSTSCDHGCDSTTNKCITIHPDEGKDCGVVTENGIERGDSRCDGDIFLYCDYDSYESYPDKTYIYRAEPCKYDSSDPRQCYSTLGCYEPCSKVSETSTCYGDYIEIDSCIEEPLSHIKYKKSDIVYCEHGCDESSKQCITIHPDEGKECSYYQGSSNYYPDQCDGNIYLSCEYSGVSATDCGSALCHADLGCYEPCDTVGEHVNKCVVDGNGEVIYGYYSYGYDCVEDTESHIKYLEPDYYSPDWCDGIGSCDETTGKCK